MTINAWRLVFLPVDSYRARFLHLFCFFKIRAKFFYKYKVSLCFKIAAQISVCEASNMVDPSIGGASPRPHPADLIFLVF